MLIYILYIYTVYIYIYIQYIYIYIYIGLYECKVKYRRHTSRDIYDTAYGSTNGKMLVKVITMKKILHLYSDLKTLVND